MILPLVEHRRRRPEASGFPVVLADGQTWLLASPRFQPKLYRLTSPNVDDPLDRLFDSAIRGENLDPIDLFTIAKELLSANYDLNTSELESLLEVAPNDESRTLFETLLSALFGAKLGGKTYTQWVRASLLANGLGLSEIPSNDLIDVMAILVATNRTIPLAKFADACQELDEKSRLEMLI